MTFASVGGRNLFLLPNLSHYFLCLNLPAYFLAISQLSCFHSSFHNRPSPHLVQLLLTAISPAFTALMSTASSRRRLSVFSVARLNSTYWPYVGLRFSSGRKGRRIARKTSNGNNQGAYCKEIRTSLLTLLN